MQLTVSPFHPNELREDPVFRFGIQGDNNHRLYHGFLFNVPISRLRAYNGQRDHSQTAINLLYSAGFDLEEIVTIIGQLEQEFSKIVA